LSLGPIKRIQCSKRIHGWLNSGSQKEKISPDATEAHRCPRCLCPHETPEHILTCPHIGAHRRRYDLTFQMTRKMIPNSNCEVQRIFAQCVKDWLTNPETSPEPDVSQVPDEQRDHLERALAEQTAIGWHLGIRGYLSRHWAIATSANPKFKPSKHFTKASDLGRNWGRQALLQLWNFAEEMWEHRNNVLHDTSIEASRMIRDAEINKEIEHLYDQVETFASEDRWYFETLPLALRLRKPLRSRRRWLVNARVLAAKSGYRATIGQTQLTAYFQVIQSHRVVTDNSLDPDPPTEPVRTQTFLSDWRLQDPVSHSP